MEKVKYNKTALKEQRDALKKYEKFLPILLLKKMQLQTVLRQLEPEIEAKRQQMKSVSDYIHPWSPLLSGPEVDIEDYVEIREVQVEMDNIAGVEVPEFRDLTFKEIPYSLFSTPIWFDKAVESVKKLIRSREEVKTLQQKEALIREELRTTTQRCNLFEKKLIPQLKENIRRIKIFLGDQETAAVGRAKIAKSKVQEREVA